MRVRIAVAALAMWCAAAGAQQKAIFGLVSPLTVVNGQMLAAKLYTNARVPAINNFDPAAVLADARRLP